MYVGGEKTARTLCDENTEIIDLGENTIYTGFMEVHCADKPAMLMTTDGHSRWLNTKAMETFGLDREATQAAQEKQTSLSHDIRHNRTNNN